MTKDQWLLVCIIAALAIVAFAVGVPYVITHKGMRSQRANREDGRAYLREKRRWQRQKDVVSAQPESMGSEQGTSGIPPRDRPSSNT